MQQYLHMTAKLLKSRTDPTKKAYSVSTRPISAGKGIHLLIIELYDIAQWSSFSLSGEVFKRDDSV